MVGFILWISGRWQEWKRINRRGTWDIIDHDDHASFDRFIGASPAGYP